MSDDPTPEPAKPSAPRAKAPLLLLVLLVMNLGGTGFVVFKLLTATPAAASVPKPAIETTGNEVSGPVVKLDPFVVNLNEPTAPRYLKVGVELELTASEHVKVIDKAKQVMRDAQLGYLSNLSIADTLGEQGKAKIRAEMMKRFDDTIGRGRVKRMFFTEFVIQ